MSNKNRNYTNYSKPNKPAETAPEANPDENVQNLQETENKIDETLIPAGSVGSGTMLNPAASENTEPVTNATPALRIFAICRKFNATFYITFCMHRTNIYNCCFFLYVNNNWRHVF